MKTSELTGAALDWAVMKAEGPNSFAANFYYEGNTPLCMDDQIHVPEEWRPSEDWSQGGPIIERERIRIEPLGLWSAAHDTNEHTYYSGDTPLIAAMRCYVASKFGEEVDVPKDFIKTEI